MIRLARRNLPQATASHWVRLDQLPREQLVEQSPDFQELALHFLQSCLQGLSRGGGSRRSSRQIRYRIERKQGCRRVFLDPPPCSFLVPRDAGLPEQLLDPAYRVSLLIQELSDLPQQLNVLRPIITAAASAFQRFDLTETGFPETEDMLRQVEVIGDLANGTEGVRPFLHVSWPL